jgi:hypothetical protein
MVKNDVKDDEDFEERLENALCDYLDDLNDKDDSLENALRDYLDDRDDKESLENAICDYEDEDDGNYNDDHEYYDEDGGYVW